MRAIAHGSTLLKPTEVARRLGVSVPTVYRRIQDGSLPAVRLGHDERAPLRVPEYELEAWLYGERTSEGRKG